MSRRPAPPNLSIGHYFLRSRCKFQYTSFFCVCGSEPQYFARGPFVIVKSGPDKKLIDLRCSEPVVALKDLGTAQPRIWASVQK